MPLQGETQNGKPQLLAIIPSAAFAGGVISFILCPSELVKVSESEAGHFYMSCSHHWGDCGIFSVECKFKVLTLPFKVPVGTTVLLIVPLKL